MVSEITLDYLSVLTYSNWWSYFHENDSKQTNSLTES